MVLTSHPKLQALASDAAALTRTDGAITLCCPMVFTRRATADDDEHYVYAIAL